jgi:hypothetical protein
MPAQPALVGAERLGKGGEDRASPSPRAPPILHKYGISHLRWLPANETYRLPMPNDGCSS